jgi:hypothetical protein
MQFLQEQNCPVGSLLPSMATEALLHYSRYPTHTVQVEGWSVGWKKVHL